MNDLRTYLNNAKKAGRITFESDDPEVVMNKLELFAAEAAGHLPGGIRAGCLAMHSKLSGSVPKAKWLILMSGGLAPPVKTG
ncbi:MAG: hypothetical protein IJM27_01750 [Eubacterium sp.]|nr:hypothetical protein [Eubacterium sp.]